MLLRRSKWVALTADTSCPHNTTEQNLIKTADDAAQRLEDGAED